MWRELYGMYRTLKQADGISDAHGRQLDSELQILVYKDNSACRYIVCNMCTASEEAMPLLHSLQHLLEAHRIGIDVRWLPSAANLFADQLSRSWDPGDIQLSRAALKLLLNLGWFSQPPSISIQANEHRAGPSTTKDYYSCFWPGLYSISGTALEPSSRFDTSHNSENHPRTGERSSSGIRLAQSDEVPGISRDIQRLASIGDASKPGIDRQKINQPEMTRSCCSDEHRPRGLLATDAQNGMNNAREQSPVSKQ